MVLGVNSCGHGTLEIRGIGTLFVFVELLFGWVQDLGEITLLC